MSHHTLTRHRLAGAADDVSFELRREAFLARLARMSKEKRLQAARHGGFDRWECSLWAARYPNEVPLVNSEFEWIALRMADLD